MTIREFLEWTRRDLVYLEGAADQIVNTHLHTKIESIRQRLNNFEQQFLNKKGEPCDPPTSPSAS